MFGRGGPLSAYSVSARLAIAVVAASLLTAVVPFLRDWLPLTPGLMVARLALWQPLTYGFIAADPLGVIFSGLIVWSIGSSLEASWGSRRMLAFAIGTTVVAGVLTAILALVWGSLWGFSFAGAYVLSTVLWVGYGWSFGRAQMSFWGMPLSGNMFALMGVLFVVLNAAFSRSLVPMVPSFLGIGITWAYVRYGSPRVFFLKLRHWKMQRDLKHRSKHLNVVSGGRNTDRGSDRYLH